MTYFSLFFYEYFPYIHQQQIDTRVKINAEQQAELKEIVGRRCDSSTKKRTELWSRHNKHFRIPRYSELLAIHFQDAVDYLETMQIKAKGDIHIDENQSIEMLCIHARFFQAWWRTHSPSSIRYWCLCCMTICFL